MATIELFANEVIGKDPATKSDEFLETFQMAFDPPLSFLERPKVKTAVLP